jgi:hypothetical protein
MNSKLAEFITVLAFALALGVGIALAAYWLKGTAGTIAIIIIAIATIAAWQYLRRRFGRGR